MESGSGKSQRTKLGLALSGGGFRASLFHIGVLARLADLGLLRHVEAISTVSGGSIVGALYYLYVRKLLEQRSDEDITDEHYQALIEELLTHFLRAVQLNIRMRTFWNLWKNLKMFLPWYSRSDHLGELYDEYLYRPAFRRDMARMVEMREIKVTPLKNGNRQVGFKPGRDNAGRLAKVPIILINATTLNTGHNWRFEAARMGEPKRHRPVEQEVDKNMRLRRPPSYEDIVERQQNVEVGLAVAASAAVPGIFPPLALSGLYDGIRVQLVDGGVHDNQGVQGLIDPDVACTHFVVSDASGPLQDESEPGTDAVTVLSRSNNTMMDRVREEQLIQLLSGEGGKVAFMHLRKGLAARAVAWNRPDGQAAEPERLERRTSGSSIDFEITEEVQDLLSRIRTDLDSFTDIEAYSLMLDGYNMSRAELESLGRSLSKGGAAGQTGAPNNMDWIFKQIAPWAGNPSTPNYGRYLQHLKTGQSLFFKPFRLNVPLTVVTLLVLAAILIAAYVYFQDSIDEFLARPLSWLLAILAVVALGWIAPKLAKAFEALHWLRTPAEVVTRAVIYLFVAVGGGVLVRLYLWVFDRLYLSMGRVERLK